MEKPRVLVVDDEKEICELTRSYLVRRDFEVLTALTAGEALNLLKDKPPRIVLLDMRLGGESGLDLLRKIKEIDRNIKVVMVTALEDTESMRQASELGADDYLSKPFRADYLIELINKKLSG
jgi:DNA-binding response OmpR family regulator